MFRRFLLLLFLLFCLQFSSILARADDEDAAEAEKTNKIEPEGPNEAETDAFKDPSGGFGTDIDWVPWPQAVSVALDLNRPIFLLVHKSWCGACQALKKSFATSSKRKELTELSNQFVMSNTDDEDEPEDEEYAPDGHYIPRLFILDKYGKRYPVDNKKNFPSNIAYFPQVPDVIRAMKMGLELFEKEQSGEKTEEGESDQKTEKKKMEKEETAEKKTTGAESAEKKSAKSAGGKTKGAVPKADEDVGKGGCPHAAGKAAAKAKKEEEEAKKQKKEAEKKEGTEKKSKEKKEGTEKKSKEKKEGTEKKKEGTEKKSKEKKEGTEKKKEAAEKKTDTKKAEQQKKKKGGEKGKEEL